MARGAGKKTKAKRQEDGDITNMFDLKEEKEEEDKTKEEDDDSEDDEPAPVRTRPKQGIKTTPLILLIMMVGTTVLPAIIYASDYLGAYVSKNNVMGSIGFKMGIGAVPKQRVLSFYEKHDPTKLPDIPKILSNHYGNYPKLVKKLERKYQDYGYFIGWEQDEAPLTLAINQLVETRDFLVNQYWNRYAPQQLKTAARNVNYNISFLVKKGRKLWKKKVWPILEPFFGVPKGTEKQKRQDAKEAKERKAAKTKSSSKTRKKNRDFRDDDEF